MKYSKKRTGVKTVLTTEKVRGLKNEYRTFNSADFHCSVEKNMSESQLPLISGDGCS